MNIFLAISNLHDGSKSLLSVVFLCSVVLLLSHQVCISLYFYPSTFLAVSCIWGPFCAFCVLLGVPLNKLRCLSGVVGRRNNNECY